MIVGVLRIAFFIVVFAAMPAIAEEPCPTVVPKVSVKSLSKETKKYNNQSAFNLTMLHSRGPRAQGTTLGLHVSPFIMTADYKYKTKEIGEKTCVSLDAVQVKFYSQPVLLVASNFPEDSCEFKAILEHEKGHDKILRGVQREYSDKTRSEMKGFVKKFRGAGAVSPERIPEIKKRIEGQMERKFEEIVKEAGSVLNSRQKGHDTRQEYKRVEAKCDNWEKTLKGE